MGECLRAYRRGDDDEYAVAGAAVEVRYFMQIDAIYRSLAKAKR